MDARGDSWLHNIRPQPSRVTADEYEQLPEEIARAIEIVDGYVVYCEPPTPDHQTAGGFAIAQAHGVFDTAYVESAGAMSRATERPEDVRVLTYRYEASRSDALPQRESLELIKDTLQRWTS